MCRPLVDSLVLEFVSLKAQENGERMKYGNISLKNFPAVLWLVTLCQQKVNDSSVVPRDIPLHIVEILQIDNSISITLHAFRARAKTSVILTKPSIQTE